MLQGGHRPRADGGGGRLTPPVRHDGARKKKAEPRRRRCSASLCNRADPEVMAIAVAAGRRNGLLISSWPWRPCWRRCCRRRCFHQGRGIHLGHVALHAVVAQVGDFGVLLAFPVDDVALADLRGLLLLILLRTVAGQALVLFQGDFVEVVHRVGNHRRLLLVGAGDGLLQARLLAGVGLHLGGRVAGGNVGAAHGLGRIGGLGQAGEGGGQDGQGQFVQSVHGRLLNGWSCDGLSGLRPPRPGRSAGCAG